MLSAKDLIAPFIIKSGSKSLLNTEQIYTNVEYFQIACVNYAYQRMY
jgi:hypothetical protein